MHDLAAVELGKLVALLAGNHVVGVGDEDDIHPRTLGSHKKHGNKTHSRAQTECKKIIVSVKGLKKGTSKITVTIGKKKAVVTVKVK